MIVQDYRLVVEWREVGGRVGPGGGGGCVWRGNHSSRSSDTPGLGSNRWWSGAREGRWLEVGGRVRVVH